MEYLPIHDNNVYCEHATLLRYKYIVYLIQVEV